MSKRTTRKHLWKIPASILAAAVACTMFSPLTGLAEEAVPEEAAVAEAVEMVEELTAEIPETPEAAQEIAGEITEAPAADDADETVEADDAADAADDTAEAEPEILAEGQFRDEQQAAIEGQQEIADGSLVIGMYGDDVAEVQQALADLGYLDTVIDGYFGPYTENAVISFQSDYGLYVDGVVGPYTYSALMAALSNTSGEPAETSSQETGSDAASDNDSNTYDSLTIGATGEAVRRVQQALADLGFLDTVIDGYYGPYTAGSVLAFQTANGLYEDGIAGPITQGVLFSKAGDSQDDKEDQDDKDGQNKEDQDTQDKDDKEESKDSEKDEASDPIDASDNLTIGATGENVRRVQQALADLGYLDTVIDGYYGQFTANAVTAFQKDHGLYVDGEAGPMTLAALADLQPITEVTSRLEEGMEGNEVLNVQKILSGLGYSVFTDGDYGRQTTWAIEKFQLYNNLPVTGVVDEATIPVLNSADAAPYTTLYAGDSGSTVTAVQQMLYDLGYLKTPADGDFGSYTREALRAFQLANDLPADGVINEATTAKLLSKPVAADENQALLPSNTVTVENYGDDSERLLVTWTEVPGADGYYVYRATSEDGEYQLVNITETACKYVDWYLDANTTYYYFVEAYTGEPLSNPADKTYVSLSNTDSATTKSSRVSYLWENYSVWPNSSNTVYAYSATDEAAQEIYSMLEAGNNFYLFAGSSDSSTAYSIFYNLKKKVSNLNDYDLGFVSLKTTYDDGGYYFLIDAQTYTYVKEYVSMAYEERMEEYGIYLDSGKSDDYFYEHHTETEYDNNYIASYRDSLFETPFGTKFNNMSTESQFLFTTPGTNMVMRTDYMIFDLDYNTVGESAIDIIMKMSNKTAIGVCRHFALAVDTVCDYLDIPCWTPIDYGYNHEWAIVQTYNNDGDVVYYLVDNQNVVELKSEADLKYRPVLDEIWDYTYATKREMGSAYPF